MKRKKSKKKKIAIVLLILQVLVLSGFESQQGNGIAEMIGYYIGFFLLGIVGIILLKSAKKDELKVKKDKND